MTQPNGWLRRTVDWLMDPVARKCSALQRAERKGIVRMMDALERALAEADAHGIRFCGEQLDQYLQVIKAVAPMRSGLPASLPARPAHMVPVPSTSPATILPASPAPSPKGGPGLFTYLVSSATLAEAHALLTRSLPGSTHKHEWMLAVTGLKQDHHRTLEHLIEVQLAVQTGATASFDMRDFARVAYTLYEQGLPLHAIFHSHRFAGRPTPSGVDWRLQDVLDQVDYPAIQAVFSEDGYVRFFARRPFAVSVLGKGVECVDQEGFLYRIICFGTLPQPGRTAASSRERAAL